MQGFVAAKQFRQHIILVKIAPIHALNNRINPIKTHGTWLARQSHDAQTSRRLGVRAATGSTGGSSPPPNTSLAVQQLVGSSLYRTWLQLGVVAVVLMGLDAAYSGDWSRIGAITKEQEAQLAELVMPSLGWFHLACTAVAAAVSSQRGERWLPRAAKVAAVGFLALVEVVLLPERDIER